MKHLIAAAIILVAFVTGPLTVRATPTAADTPQHVADDPIPDHDVDWARGRFGAAGLDLPPVEFEFHADGRSACGGNVAVASHGGATEKIIVCTDAAAAEVVVRRTLLHELAHVWAEHALEDTTRRSFVESRGAASWNAPNTPWSERGSEQAAEVITWALMDRELSMLTLEDHDPAHLAAGYRLLTGQAVPPR